MALMEQPKVFVNGKSITTHRIDRDRKMRYNKFTKRGALVKAFIAFVLIYLLIGMGVTSYRAREDSWSRGGPAIIFAYLIYPVIYPAMELSRASEKILQQRNRLHMDMEHVALLSPPAYQSLLQEVVLSEKENPLILPYDALLEAVKKNPLPSDDHRVGYVLEQITRSTKKMGDVGRARADVASLLHKGETTSLPDLWVAAAILRGAHSANPGDNSLTVETLSLYKRVYSKIGAIESPFAAYSLATAYDVCGQKQEAIALYKEAFKTGRLDIAMQSLLRAVYNASDDDERIEVLKEFHSRYPYKNKFFEELFAQNLEKTGWGDYHALSWNYRQKEAAQMLGRHLLPLYPLVGSEQEAFDAKIDHYLELGGVSRAQTWWRELIARMEPAFTHYPAKLKMVEILLDSALGMQNECSIGDICTYSAREVYYYLYSRTGDMRWLEHALDSQLRVRPLLANQKSYIEGEIALMKGQYRKHFELTARRYLEHWDYASIQDSRATFIGDTMQSLEIHAGNESMRYDIALSEYIHSLINFFYEKDLAHKEHSAEQIRFLESERGVPFHDFSDKDVKKRGN